jgi:hypothetical protein
MLLVQVLLNVIMKIIELYTFILMLANIELPTKLERLKYAEKEPD